MSEFAGSICVGLNQTLIGLPFDTIKVWLQNKEPIKNKNFMSLYRGWKPELLNSLISNNIVFPIHAYTLKYTKNSFLSGFLGGVLATPFIFSFKTFKIKNQMKQKVNFKTLLNFQGYTSTMLRESTGMAMYFGMYNYFKSKDYPIAIAGGLGGLFNWGCSYPFDIILSRQIAQNISFKEAVKQRNLFKGYGVCLLRSIIVNASSFFIFEKVLESLK